MGIFPPPPAISNTIEYWFIKVIVGSIFDILISCGFIDTYQLFAVTSILGETQQMLFAFDVAFFYHWKILPNETI